jgi:TonB-linked SusC/RagA family outer membrane protein
MKLTALILIIALTQISAKSYSQKINLHKINISLKSALDTIEKQTGYTYFVKNFDLSKPIISISLKNATLDEAIRKCLKNLPLTYKITGKDITLIRISPSRIANAVNKMTGLFQDIDVHGTVVDENGIALQGAVIRIKNGQRTSITDIHGEFGFQSVSDNAVLSISHLGYNGIELNAGGELGQIKLRQAINLLHEVVISTGYQKIAKEKTTGSFTLIDSKLMNRSISPDFISRLKGVANGILADSEVGNTTGISVRGRSTLFSDTKPLIVIDNFPFEGDLNTINPNDIEDVTVLKDAAAAAIWGVRAGNGVIVITTKKGRLNQKTKIEFNTNVTIGDKPDLYYQPQMSSAEFIDLEKFLYSKGRYNSALRTDYENISPVIALLSKETPSNTVATQADIEALKNNDARDQSGKYFYRKSIQQQYYLSLTGGGTGSTYHLSAGYDHLNPVTAGASNARYTLKSNNSYDLVNHKIQLTADITFSRSIAKNDNINGYSPLYPYEQIADQNGNALAVLTSSGLRASYTDTAGNGNLLNWKYRPLNELKKKANSFKGESTDIRVNTGLRYQILKPLAFSVNYQYFRSTGLNETLRSMDSYTTRNAINEVTQINRTTGAITNPMPIGDQFNRINNSLNADYERAQLDFRQAISRKHNVNVIAGYEIRSENASSNTQKLYGYDPETEISAIVDPITAFPYYTGAKTTRIGNNPNSQNGSVDHYISYYGNAIYIYDDRIILSGSYRRDESNLFGVSANKKGIPLFSTGIAWTLDKEKFYTLNWMPRLQLRTTYGYNGNVNKTISAFTTTSPSLSLNYWGAPFSVISNPPNPSLRWERVKNVNFGIDFGTKNEILSGSIEYYLKNGTDLIGTSPIAQQTGLSTFTGNMADTHTRGFDILLNSRNLNGLFKWATTAIFNVSKDKVTNYQANTGSNFTIVSSSQSINPLRGYPILSVFSFRSDGLDDQGKPKGFIDGIASENYTSINNSKNRGDLKYEGSAVPIFFGSFRNTFSFKSFELSVNLSYKFDYYFRRTALQYSALYNGDYHSDEFSKRWQKPGDELITRVPALMYPDDSSQDHFYAYSEGTAEKGDHIRLNDIRLGYTLSNVGLKKIGLSAVDFYMYANNLGILWRANKRHIDPDARNGYPASKSISIGIKTGF